MLLKLNRIRSSIFGIKYNYIKYNRLKPAVLSVFSGCQQEGATNAAGVVLAYSTQPPMSIMAYICCQNYSLLLIIILCDIDITFCNMHSLFGYFMSHCAIFIL